MNNDTPPNDKFKNQLTTFLVTAFIMCVPLLTFKTIPIENKETIVYIIGQLSGMALMALGFYFTNKAGADALDAKRADADAMRAETTKSAFEAVTATAQAAGGTNGAGVAADAVAGAANDKADEINGTKE